MTALPIATTASAVRDTLRRLAAVEPACEPPTDVEVAVAETIHHHARFMARTDIRTSA